MNQDTTDNNTALITFTRLPVFDAKKNLWGYKLIYMSNAVITADLISDTSIALEQIMDNKKNIMVEFSQSNIIDHLPYGLPPGRTIIKISDPPTLSDTLIKQLVKLKNDDYKIALTWTKNHTDLKELFNLADIICMDITNQGLHGLTDIYKESAPYDAMILADGVDNKTKFDICRETGFAFFQGGFFKRLEDVSIKKLIPGTISRFKIMEAIEQNNPDFDQIAKIIQEDVTISFRLLSHLNSASFGFRKKIDSIKDAITMLGWHNLKNWLRVVVLGEISDHQHASELVFLSAQRGKFLKQVGKDHDFWGFEPDSLFLLGMFSLLDALLNQPMSQIVKYIPLADKLKGALCMETNNEYVPLLNLARHFEEAQFDKTRSMINQLALDSQKVEQA
ncbi:MAG: HDOD domain-containing protein, partial [Desulfobacula sp.]|nr:HDOD domain-containing protein [Desulfobacula sp.]